MKKLFFLLLLPVLCFAESSSTFNINGYQGVLDERPYVPPFQPLPQYDPFNPFPGIEEPVLGVCPMPEDAYLGHWDDYFQMDDVGEALIGGEQTYLKAENTLLRQKVSRLEARVKELEAQLRAQK